MECISFSFNFNFAERDAQLLNETEFCDFEENDDFFDYNSDAKEHIKEQSELEQEIIVSNENNDYQDDIEDTEIPLPSSPPSQSLPSPPISLILTDILPLSISIEIPHPSISTKTPPPIPIEEQSKPI
ncbi:3401_t:CDS:2, partial [Funneliformis geosporum]